MHVLVLCYGNSCRSPMAEALMRDLAQKRGLRISVSSAGITNGLGRAHEYSIQAMQDYGLDIHRHRAKEVTSEMVQGADLILTLDRTVQEELLRKFPDTEGKVRLLRKFAFGNGTNPDIQDPYPSHNLTVYRRCAEEIREAAEAVLNRLRDGRGERVDKPMVAPVEPTKRLISGKANSITLAPRSTRREASGGVIFSPGIAPLIEPGLKRTIAFVDGQNLFHAAREAFGYTYPNYDVRSLAQRVCQSKGWALSQVRFYTGVPDASDNAFWNRFWTHKLAHLGRQGVWTFSRPLRYRNRRVNLPDGTEHTFLVGEEKGVDVRLASDVVRMAYRNEYDVALPFSQDQDLSEVAVELRTIAREQNRWIKIASAYPQSPTYRNLRGIDKTDWIPMDRALYAACLDSRDYRPKRNGP